MKIFGFYSFKSRSGKDTAARFFQDELEARGHTVATTAFADVMKIVAADALGITGDDATKIALIDAIKEEGQVSWRTGLTGFTTGTRSGRDFIIGLAGGSDQTYGMRRWQQTIWIDLCLDAVPDLDADYLLITDMRFKPEAQAVWDRRGWVIDVQSSARGVHKNEDSLEYRDFVVNNDGTLIALRERMIQLAVACIDL